MSPPGRSRALVAMSRSTSGSRLSRLIVGGTDPVVQREDGGDRLERAGAAEQVAGHRLGAGDHDVVDVAPSVACSISPSATSPCGVEVACALTWTIASGPMSASARAPQDRPRAPRPARVGLRDVVGVGGDAGAEHLGVDLRAAGLGVLRGLEDEHAGALAEHEAVAAGVPRARGRGRVVVASWTAPSCWRTRRSAAGGSPPRCRRRRRRRRGRAGSCRGASRSPRRRTRRRRPGCAPRPARRVEADVRGRALGISIGTVSGETRRGPFSFSTS